MALLGARVSIVHALSWYSTSGGRDKGQQSPSSISSTQTLTDHHGEGRAKKYQISSSRRQRWKGHLEAVR